MLKEITETDIVLRIEPLHKCRFAYALMPGNSAAMPWVPWGVEVCFFGWVAGGVLDAVLLESGW